MVNYFIYAKDFSGSTEGVAFYHNNGLKTINEFKSDVEKIKEELEEPEKITESKVIYLHWGHECVQVNEETAVDTYKNQDGDGHNTLPETIIQWIQRNIDCSDENNKIRLLYIITDGLIGSHSMHTCLELNREMDYKTVVFHAFHKNLREVDLSVASSFLKSICKIYRNQELFDDVDISEDFDYDKINIDNFKTEKENLKSYVKLKYLTSAKSDARALAEIDKLKNLRDRLFAKVSPETRKSDHTKLNTKDKNVFLEEFVISDWYQKLKNPSYGERVDIEKAISTLINYIVNDKKNYSFDALKFDTKFSDDVEEEDIVDMNFKPEQEIEFPDIILDDEKGVPVIILTEFNLLDKIIFHGTKNSRRTAPASFSKFKSAMDCPLFIANDADISQSIGYFYTLTVYKQLLEKTTRKEPRTRRPFRGGLVLVDTGEFDKYNDYILSATYFNSKKVNFNVGLFYYVLWKKCESKQWMDKNVVAQLKKYVMRRVSSTSCRIGLSSLPLDPQIKTSLPTALWYCLELSSCIFKDDPEHFMHERLRLYHGVTHHMIEILKNLNYTLDLELIANRKDIIKHVMALKKIPLRTDKMYFLLEKIFKKKNGFLICELEHPDNLSKLNYLKFDHKGMFCDDVVEEKVNLNDFVHLMYVVDASWSENCKMNEKTFRPFFTIDQNNSFYSDVVKFNKKVILSNDEKNIKITYEAIDNLEFSRILSVNNLFINYVKDKFKYPTLEEYIEYISNKRKTTNNLVTVFPPNVNDLATCAYSFYENVMKTVDAQVFLSVCKKYVSRVERIKAEGILKFDSDKDIEEFIKKEEIKVKVIKT